MVKLVSVEKIKSAKIPSDIFDFGIETIKIQYRHYVRKYHPDIYPDKNVMVIINDLYEKALKMIATNNWIEDGVVYFYVQPQGKFRLCYRKEYPFEFGTMYVCDSLVAYVFNDGAVAEKAYWRYVTILKEIKYVDDKMREYFSQQIPNITKHGKLKDNRNYIIVQKSPNMYPLKEIIKIYKGHIVPVHMSWIMTRLNNLIVLLGMNHIVHNGIIIDNIFINPSNHNLAILGGWWHAGVVHGQMLSCSKEVYGLMPPNVKTDKLNHHVTDIESIKNIFRNITDKNIIGKNSLWEYAKSGSDDDFMKNLKKWEFALEKAYGQRTFVKMDVNKDVIYK